MHGSKLGLLAAVALVAGLAGCSLPEVLPIANGSTSGPSPYGPWYEQHWATNAVLLAAADQPDGAAVVADQVPSDTAASGDALGADETNSSPKVDAPVEASAAANQRAADFDSSTPYQFPASSYAPVRSAESVPADDAPAPTPEASKEKPAPATGGPIRY